MDEFFRAVATKFGMSESAAATATGQLLSIVRGGASSADMGKLLDRIPGSASTLEAAESARPGGAGPLGGAVRAASSRLGGRAGSALARADVVERTGLGPDHAAEFVTMFVRFIEDKAGDPLAKRLVAGIPELRNLVGVIPPTEDHRSISIMTYKIQDIEGIGPAFQEKLAKADISSTDHLLKHCCEPKGRKAVSEKTGISETMILKWVNMADLMRVSGVGGEFAELLEAAGVDTVKELKTRNAENLAEKMREINEVKSLTRQVPASSSIQKWIEQAKSMEPAIAH